MFLYFSTILILFVQPSVCISYRSINQLLNAKPTITSGDRLTHRVSEYDSTRETLTQYQYEGKYAKDVIELQKISDSCEIILCKRQEQGLVITVNIMNNETEDESSKQKFIKSKFYPGAILLIPGDFGCPATDNTTNSSIFERIISISSVRSNGEVTSLTLSTFPSAFKECFEDVALEFFQGPPNALETSRAAYWSEKKKNNTKVTSQSISRGDVDSWFGKSTPDMFNNNIKKKTSSRETYVVDKNSDIESTYEWCESILNEWAGTSKYEGCAFGMSDTHVGLLLDDYYNIRFKPNEKLTKNVKLKIWRKDWNLWNGLTLCKTYSFNRNVDSGTWASERIKLRILDECSSGDGVLWDTFYFEAWGEYEGCAMLNSCIHSNPGMSPDTQPS